MLIFLPHQVKHKDRQTDILLRLVHGTSSKHIIHTDKIKVCGYEKVMLRQSINLF